MRNPENEAGINAILNVIDSWYFEPEACWPREVFEEHSQQRWAINEILQVLIDNPEDPADWLIENFRDRMVYCWALAEEDDRKSMLFCTAISVAEDILEDIIYMM